MGITDSTCFILFSEKLPSEAVPKLYFTGCYLYLLCRKIPPRFDTPICYHPLTFWYCTSSRPPDIPNSFNLSWNWSLTTATNNQSPIKYWIADCYSLSTPCACRRLCWRLCDTVKWQPPFSHNPQSSLILSEKCLLTTESTGAPKHFLVLHIPGNAF